MNLLNLIQAVASKTSDTTTVGGVTLEPLSWLAILSVLIAVGSLAYAIISLRQGRAVAFGTAPSKRCANTATQSSQAKRPIQPPKGTNLLSLLDYKSLEGQLLITAVMIAMKENAKDSLSPDDILRLLMDRHDGLLEESETNKEIDDLLKGINRT